jgi:N-acetylglucosaminyldiphosphoundecaprenol N-acetyl-beta-D-mannosaminyltransferase
MTTPTTSFLGMSFHMLNINQVVDWLIDRRADAPFEYVVTPNVDHIVKLDTMPAAAEAKQAYDAAMWRLCDSRVLAKLAAMRDIDLTVVPGSDLTMHLFRRVIESGNRICLIGGDAEMGATLRERFPEIELLHHIPPMGMLRKPAAMDAAVQFVVDARARFTFLAVSLPQQEILGLRIKQRGDAIGTGFCIGASIEFLTGKKARAPLWMRRKGLEWLHRLASEPRRLWRRYLVEGPKIFLIYARWTPPRS